MAFEVFGEKQMAAAEQKLYHSDWPGFGQHKTNGGLSEREWEIMLAIAKGESPALTANRLGLSVKTVSTYRARIVQKTGLRSNAEIAVAAYKQGLIK